MNRRRADVVAGLVVAAIFVFGGVLSWQAYQQNRELDQTMGSMMGTSMSAAHGTNPLWYVFGTVLLAGVVGGVYLAVRTELAPARGRAQTGTGVASEVEAVEHDDAATTEAEPATDEVPTAPRDEDATATDTETEPESPPTTNEQTRPRILDVLPEDERRVLEPVVTSPGITQIELRDRSDFSKSKVSQTVSALEKRGLLYRERQGRTYRIYPSDDLTQNHVQ